MWCPFEIQIIRERPTTLCCMNDMSLGQEAFFVTYSLDYSSCIYTHGALCITLP